MDPTKRPLRICIIGAGPTGLLTLYRFLQLEDPVPEIVCYEKQSTWGGQWNFTWRTGTDTFGEHISSCVYKNLWSNNPKEVIELPHYTFERHFGRPIPSFISQPVLRDYIGGLFKISKSNMEDRIQYNTAVRNVRYNDSADDFTVLVTDLPSNRIYSETFSHVIVASGIFTTPFVPEIEGISSFPGLVLHSQYIKRSEMFQGKRVLLIGSSFSAIDLASMAHKYGATHVIICYRRKAPCFDWPDKIEERPMVSHFTKNKAEFKDGSSAEVDIVVFCTGHHPFLDENLRIKDVQPNFYPDHLYRGVVWQKGGNQKLLYIGLQINMYSFFMFDVQAAWIVAYITGTRTIDKTERPRDISLTVNRHDMKEEIFRMQEKYTLAKTADNEIGFFTEYMQSLADEISYKVDFWKHLDLVLTHRKYQTGHVMAYRDCQYTSVYTGNLAPKPKIPWLERHEDDLETFMNSF